MLIHSCLFGLDRDTRENILHECGKYLKIIIFSEFFWIIVAFWGFLFRVEHLMLLCTNTFMFF